MPWYPLKRQGIRPDDDGGHFLGRASGSSLWEACKFDVHDLSAGRELGQMFIVMDPSRFVGLDAFKASMSKVLDELGEMPAAEGFDKVYYPGERAVMRRDKAYATGGVR